MPDIPLRAADDPRVIEGSERKYEVESIRGRGGFATTYRARVVGTEERVLIKELRLDRADSWKAVELFEREAKSLAQLDNPRIPRVLEYFSRETNGADGSGAQMRFFLVQELVLGPTLAERVATLGPLAEGRVISLLRELLGVLDYLHTRAPPLVHRDVTPSNVILGDDGLTRLVDFGAVQARAVATSGGGSTMVGTPGYMPMEQIMGQARPATDLYALGMTVLFALSGKSPADLPVDDATGSVAVERAVPGISVPLRRVLDALTKPLVGERLKSASEALSLLDGALDGQQAKLAARSHDPVVLGAALVLAVVAGGAVASHRMAAKSVEHAHHDSDPSPSNERPALVPEAPPVAPPHWQEIPLAHDCADGREWNGAACVSLVPPVAPIKERLLEIGTDATWSLDHSSDPPYLLSDCVFWGWLPERRLAPAKWIWGSACSATPREAHRFSKHFEVPASFTEAHLEIAADDVAIASVNGKPIQRCTAQDGRRVTLCAVTASLQTATSLDIRTMLHPGSNLVEISVQNLPDAGNEWRRNPAAAGLIARITVKSQDQGKSQAQDHASD